MANLSKLTVTYIFPFQSFRKLMQSAIDEKIETLFVLSYNELSCCRYDFHETENSMEILLNIKPLQLSEIISWFIMLMKILPVRRIQRLAVGESRDANAWKHHHGALRGTPSISAIKEMLLIVSGLLTVSD